VGSMVCPRMVLTEVRAPEVCVTWHLMSKRRRWRQTFEGTWRSGAGPLLSRSPHDSTRNPQCVSPGRPDMGRVCRTSETSNDARTGALVTLTLENVVASRTDTMHASRATTAFTYARAARQLLRTPTRDSKDGHRPAFQPKWVSKVPRSYSLPARGPGRLIF